MWVLFIKISQKRLTISLTMEYLHFSLAAFRFESSLLAPVCNASAAVLRSAK